MLSCDTKNVNRSIWYNQPFAGRPADFNDTPLRFHPHKYGESRMRALRSKNTTLLAITQALGSSGAPIVVFVGGIIGAEIAPSPVLATLPMSLMVVGVALATIPAALLMRRVGRRKGYMTGSTIGILAALLAAYAISLSSFALFCTATMLIGVNGAFIQQYRFGAAESVPAERSGQAVSFVLLGGIAAGFLGPEIAQRTEDLLPAGPFSGSFVILAGLLVVVLVLLYFLDEILPPVEVGSEPERPLRQVISQPVYLTAIIAGVVAYGVMSFIMTATPVEMHTMHGFSLQDTAWVIQSHIIAMYLPSLFTGFLLVKLGLRRVMMMGWVCLLACVGLGIISRELLEYWGTLVLLGVGWNFLFVGATVLLTQSYRPAERFKAQAVNDFTIFGIQALASLSAGTVLFRANWQTLMILNLPVLVIMLLVLMQMRRWQPKTIPG
jgi:MFS family permease